MNLLTQRPVRRAVTGVAQSTPGYASARTFGSAWMGNMGATAKQILEALTRNGASISNLTSDSRAVRPGDLFLAYPGAASDGRDHIGEAIAHGAAAVVWEHDGFEWNRAWKVANVGVIGVRALAGHLASLVYGRPSTQMLTVGVTGTNGKTSCSQWLAQAYAATGRATAVIGTLGHGFPGHLGELANTTPDAAVLHQLLAAYRDRGASAVAMEASSIGLTQGRLNGVSFDTALFTNLTRDHLDFHVDMERYAAAKTILFDWPGLKHAVLNFDDALGRRLALRLADRVERIGYSMDPDMQFAAAHSERFLHAEHIVAGVDGVHFTVNTWLGRQRLVVPVLGRFNVANLLGVLGVLLASGVGLKAASAALRQLQPIGGRMERLGGGAQPTVVIDYAHSPDALEQVLGSLSELVGTSSRRRRRQLICVFGCGGERDPGKRPIMGELASRLAHRVVLTSDNPRREDAIAIIDAIRAGVPFHRQASIEVIPERQAAIRAAIEGAASDDLVLIAGKGHESYQETAAGKFPFSDRDEAETALARRSR